MTSNKPYLLRAFYEWILDNRCSPYLLVEATLPYVEVPERFINEGKIILNIHPQAIAHFDLGNEWITFSARFSGVEEQISIPVGAVIAIYAQENGQGMGFEPEALPEDYDEATELKKSSKTTSLSDKLSIVTGDGEQSEKDSDTPKRKKGRPNLRIID